MSGWLGNDQSSDAGNATVSIQGSALGTQLMQLLLADGIEPGSDPGYQTCKTIYLYHPLGEKMASAPIAMAQSQAREITVGNTPEDAVRDQFIKQWKADRADEYIFNTARTSRIYGVGSIIYGAVVNDQPIDPKSVIKLETLPSLEIYFNVLDPLNTAGSLVLDQNPNSPTFQKYQAITASGVQYHRSRAIALLNENPIYLGYTSAAFGYVGRSVYQRSIFPLKSFIQSMITDDLVTYKAGLIVAKMKQAGAIADNIMKRLAGIKRSILKAAGVGNVISISIEESIESINLQNLDAPMTMARKNILENIAVSADMPAKLLNAETFAEGFGEGTEDAKNVARYIDRMREWMQPLYDWFDTIIMYRAWSPEFIASMKEQYPDVYGAMDNTAIFMKWRNEFKAIWPSLLTEPDSEKSKTEKVRQEALLALFTEFFPNLDPDNQAKLMEGILDNLNECKLLVKIPIELDWSMLVSFLAKRQENADAATDNEMTADKNEAASMGEEQKPPMKKAA